MDTKHTIRQATLTAWQNATKGKAASPLMAAIGEWAATLPDIIEDMLTRRDIGEGAYKLGRRIAKAGDQRDGPKALDYHSDWKGEWEVTNGDLKQWRQMTMWIRRYLCEEVANALTGDISRALSVKRLQQAFDRYRKSGLTAIHCALLRRMLWEMDMGRWDGVSLYVQGKRPFGNSGIETDIYECAGWEMKWLEDDRSLTTEEDERAWNLFDELVFAAPDAAMIAQHACAAKESAEKA